MSEIVNLKRARKQRERADEAAKAAQARISHGRTKAEKKSSEAESAAAAKRLDAHKRDPNAKID